LFFASIKLYTVSGTPVLHRVNIWLQEKAIISRGNTAKQFCRQEKEKQLMFNYTT
jgi:hypothetical protein